MVDALLFLAALIAPPPNASPVDVIIKNCPSADAVREKVRAIVGSRRAAWPDDHYFVLLPAGTQQGGWYIEQHLGPEVTHRDGPFAGTCSQIEDSISVYVAGEILSRPEPVNTSASVADNRQVSEPEPKHQSQPKPIATSDTTSVAKHRRRRGPTRPNGPLARIGVGGGVLTTQSGSALTDEGTDMLMSVVADTRVARRLRVRLEAAASLSPTAPRGLAYARQERLMLGMGICGPTFDVVRRVALGFCGTGYGGKLRTRSKDFIDEDPRRYTATLWSVFVDSRGVFSITRRFSVGIAGGLGLVLERTTSGYEPMQAHRVELIIAWSFGR